MERLPFSVYDFFGYLAAGAVLLAAVDLGFFHAAHVADDPSLTGGILAILAAYIVGQLVAGLASAALEAGLVGRLLGRPARALTEPAAGWRTRLLSSTTRRWPRRRRSGTRPVTRRLTCAARSSTTRTASSEG